MVLRGFLWVTEGSMNDFNRIDIRSTDVGRVWLSALELGMHINFQDRSFLENRVHSMPWLQQRISDDQL